MVVRIQGREIDHRLFCVCSNERQEICKVSNEFISLRVVLNYAAVASKFDFEPRGLFEFRNHRRFELRPVVHYCTSTAKLAAARGIVEPNKPRANRSGLNLIGSIRTLLKPGNWSQSLVKVLATCS